jgi:multiple sugar transport system substrate-binding protein
MDPEAHLNLALTALSEDEENPVGPKRGRYQLSLKFLREIDSPEELELWIEDNQVDLITVDQWGATAMGENGLLLPLDQLTGADGPALTQSFYPLVLDQYRQGALYALPLDALPVMLNYYPPYFREEPLPPDGSWNWDDLVESAAALTRRKEDGSVARWGVIPHFHGLWWALWQNEAVAVDPDTQACRLQEPAATEALQFIHDLIHTHRVTPAVEEDLWKFVFQPTGQTPAMVYTWIPMHDLQRKYRVAALPRGKVQAVPIWSSMGIAITSRTKHPEAAYTALKALVGMMQASVHVPAQKEAVARLGELRPELAPEEVEAYQQSMAHGREWFSDVSAARYAMHEVWGMLVRGDDVASIVNEGCSLVSEFQRTGGNVDE